jgi:translocation and assembly module TamA
MTKFCFTIYQFIRLKANVLLVFVIFFVPFTTIHAQNFTLTIHTIQAQEAKILTSYKYQKTHKDSVMVLKTLQNLVTILQEDGFLEASLDSMFCKEKQFHAYLHIAKSYRFLQLNIDNIPKELLQYIHDKPKNIAKNISKKGQNHSFYYMDFLKLKTNILRISENNGYPFAKVYLDSIQFKTIDLSQDKTNYKTNNENNYQQEQGFSAILRYEKGTYIRFDSLLIIGKNPLKIKRAFLENYLKLYKNQPFSQKKVEEAEKLLRKLPYLQLTQKLETTFERDRAFLILHSEALKINQFDGIVGLLPNAAQNNQLQFTGQVNLKLYNLLQSGKTLLLEWQSPRSQSQLLNLSYEHPNLFKSGIDITSSLHLNKRDTSFVNFRWALQFAYNLGGNAKVFVFTEFRQSTSDSSQVNQPIRNVADTKVQLYGLGYEFQNLNNLQTPRKGWHIRLTTSAGNKEIKPLWDTNDSIYKTLQLQSTQIQFTSLANYYLKTGKNTTLLFRINAGLLLNNNLFINELFQLGGIRSLRGFNEMSFFSPYYSINTLEYRLYFEQNSSLFAFADYAFMGVRIGNDTKFNTPLGLGGGLSFATKAGIFSFVAAMGQSETQSFGINQMKIHFGLVTRF